MAFTLKSTADGKYLEEKFVKWEEVGLTGPEQSPGSLWVFGLNANGGLGLGDINHRSSPIQVGSNNQWKLIASDRQSVGESISFGIKTNGTLWAWGVNGSYKILGLGDTLDRSSPVQVGALTNWNQVDTANGTTAAIKTDGTLWAWGSNYYGELGLNDTNIRSSPVQVGTLTDWKYVQVMHGASIIALKTDGTMWSWGRNTWGQLGLGGIGTPRSSPVQIGSLNTWRQISAGGWKAGAIKSDGTLWTWGYNANGQLGLNDTTNRASPQQLVGLYKQISFRGNGTAGAIKSDGTLWTWGENTYGQLGLNNTNSYSSPVQIGTLTNWNKVVMGYTGNCVALKTDGTLWTWGNNNKGQLGFSNTVNISSPAQVGTLTNWIRITTGESNTFVMNVSY